MNNEVRNEIFIDAFFETKKFFLDDSFLSADFNQLFRT